MIYFRANSRIERTPFRVFTDGPQRRGFVNNFVVERYRVCT